ncbi:MAG: NYN domain-containing protein [Planctomycetota bacterium]
MVLLVDAYNVILAEGAPPGLWSGDLSACRARLAALVLRTMGRRFKKAILVYDTRESYPSTEILPAGIQAVFAEGVEGAADRWIKNWVADRKAGTRCTVVSSDREVASWAKAHGADTIGSLDFLREAVGAGQRRGGPPPEPATKLSGLSASEVRDWMRYFGLDPDGKGDLSSS